MIRIEVTGLDEMIARIDAIGDLQPATVARLDRTMHAVFRDTQQRVHRITNSLALSGGVELEVGRNAWHGEISYGGSSPGPNDPVDYAVYEMSRGGDHDFFAGIPEFYDRFERDMVSQFSPRRVRVIPTDD